MVYILLAPGFEEAEALTPADLLRRADIETALVSLQGDTVTGSHGITVAADLSLDSVDLSRAEMVVLPGGGGCEEPGGRARRRDTGKRGHGPGIVGGRHLRRPYAAGPLGAFERKRGGVLPRDGGAARWRSGQAGCGLRRCNGRKDYHRPGRRFRL